MFDSLLLTVLFFKDPVLPYVSVCYSVCAGMEMFREGGSMTRPPMLDGANYPYWKTKMRAYLKSIDERVWMAVSEG